MEFKNGDIYINDILAWYNPDRSGIVRGINAHHDGNELWVNGKLVYVDLVGDSSQSHFQSLCDRNRRRSDIETTPPPVSKLYYYDAMILPLIALWFIFLVWYCSS